MNNNYLRIILNKSILIIVILFFIISCTKLEKTVPNDIITNNEKYDKIVETIYKSNFSRFSLRQHISKEYFPKNLVKLLNKTYLNNKIEYLILFENSNCNKNSFALISGNYNIFYNPCPDNNFPLPNSYEDIGITEPWGINENWFIAKELNDW